MHVTENVTFAKISAQ